MKTVDHPKGRLRWSRREAMLGAAAVTAAAAGRASAAPPATRPNIVFILADDLGYADIGCNGARDIRTPHIDGIAEAGVRFTDGYANSSVCSPTRLALFTGRYHQRLRAGLEEPIRPLAALTQPDRIGIPPEHPNLASLLRAAGYHTALVGKWHMGFEPHFGPLKSGYHEFFGFHPGGVDYWTHAEAGNGPAVLYEGEALRDAPGYLTDLLGDRAVEVIERQTASGTPFLLSLHFSAPHWPWEGPDDVGRTEAGRIGTIFHSDGGSRRIYADMVESMDANIGKVLEALRRQGVERDTIVVFTSDNGGERFSDVWPFSGKKSELLEGGIRVPLLAKWPARLPAGQVSGQTAISMDWLPTLLAAAGARPDPAYPPDGMDLTPTLVSGRPVERTLFWRYKAFDQKAVREGTWKYLSLNGNEFLFDLAVDPLERADQKQRQPERFARLKAAYDAWNAEMMAQIPESNSYAIRGRDLAENYAIPNPPPR